MSVTVLRESRDEALELIGVNGIEAKVLINLDTPEVDSLAEEIVSLRSYGVPDAVVSRMLGMLREAIELNGREGHGEWKIAGLLDELARPAAAGSLGAGVKELAAALRPALRILANPRRHDAPIVVCAAGLVVRAIESASVATLRSDALRNELRATAHDQLLSIVESLL